MSQDASIFDISLTMVLMLIYWHAKLMLFSCANNTERLQMLAMFADTTEILQTYAMFAMNAENLRLFSFCPPF